MARIPKADHLRIIYSSIKLNRMDIIARAQELMPKFIQAPALTLGDDVDNRVLWCVQCGTLLRNIAERATVSLQDLAHADAFSTWTRRLLVDPILAQVSKEIVSKDTTALTPDDYLLLANTRTLGRSDFRKLVVTIAIFEMTDKFRYFLEPPKASEMSNRGPVVSEIDKLCERFSRLLKEKPGSIRFAKAFLEKFHA